MAIQLTLTAITPPPMPRIELTPRRHPTVFNFGTDQGLVEINRGMSWPMKSRAIVIPAAGARSSVEYGGDDPVRVALTGDLPMVEWRGGLSPQNIRDNSEPLYPLERWQLNRNKVRLSNFAPYLRYPDLEYIIESAGPRGVQTPPFIDGIPLIYRWEVVLLGGGDYEESGG